MKKSAGTGKFRTTDDLITFVNKEGMCYLFKKDIRPCLYEMIKGDDSTARRGILLTWLEEAHLNKKLFFSVDERGRLIAMSLVQAKERLKSYTKLDLTDDEKTIYDILRRPMTTPELKRALQLPENRFKKALIMLRSRMRITLVGVKKESKTKHVNCYARIERWMQKDDKR